MLLGTAERVLQRESRLRARVDEEGAGRAEEERAPEATKVASLRAELSHAQARSAELSQLAAELEARVSSVEARATHAEKASEEKDKAHALAIEEVR